MKRVFGVGAIGWLCILFYLGMGEYHQAEAAVDESGLEIAVSVDIVGQYALQEESKASDDLRVREAEITFYGPVDHLFDGLLSAAAHYEKGETIYELHESFISSSKLIPRSRFKIGQFFLGIGKLNRVHRHDWPFISAPQFYTEFFDQEGVIDRGIEYSFLFPTPFYLDLSIGITSGRTFGHSHSEGEKPIVRTHYARLAGFLAYESVSGIEVGLNYLRRKGADRADTVFTGLDFISKNRDQKRIQFLFQGEIWRREIKPDKGELDNTLGLYLYPQYGLNDSMSIGVRYDYSTVLSQKDIYGNKESNSAQGLLANLSYRVSEFTTFGVGYQYAWERVLGETISSDRILELQTTFILGAHPAHDF